MAKELKEKWTGITKFVSVAILLASLVFTWGRTESTQDARIENTEKTGLANATEIKSHKAENVKHEAAMTERVHRVELNSKDIQNLASQSAAAFLEVKDIMTDMQKTQAKQATVQAVNSAKLESLTKD